MSNTLGQKRSEFALLKVLNVDKSLTPKFDKLVLGLPAMILQNGLGQTLAFLLAKATKESKLHTGDHHYIAYKIIADWSKDQGILKDISSPANCIMEISQMPQSEYLHMQEETLALLEWVRRYANTDFQGKG